MPSASRRLRVTTGTTAEDCREYTFEAPFRIGRVEDCDVCITGEYVSRAHVQVVLEGGQWWVRDLGSSNGTFVDGERISHVPVGDSLTIRLGVLGPFVWLETVPNEPEIIPPGEQTMVSQYIDRYFAKTASGEPAGEHTMIVRQAFERVQGRQRRRYGLVLGILGACVLAAGGYALYLQQQVGKQRATATELFYTMKSLDLDIANVERLVTDTQNQQGMAEIRKYQTRRREMEESYNRFLASLHVYNPKMSEQERLILRVARIFGECELDMPPGFVDEIQTYIGKWKSSGRLANAIRRARENGYTPVIERELLAQDLPPQFFYLALQESNFDPYISGPMTRKGIAKGMWQFIPETGVKYGLKIGPLADLPRPDPGDDRHHWDLETKAAARYLKDLYSTDAQASGFLVMSCYNWGENQVLPLVRSMPANPRERNFWQLLKKHRDKIPQETYDYVFYIASAAVIGENPRLFGFDFDDPL
ncbi:MAG TPA: FHA domain-containing protein [Bryobacteraceae bacterium]|jgi:pSer/pThr/pTyr-binding forkhead associated (FHA) protein|nr:FHA domain-containing protein [Bryobacteraceae bacterium]